MFFHSNTTVIFVTKSKIKTAVFSHAGEIVKKEKTFNWNEKNLHAVLDEIATRGASKARVVFGEEFSYVVAIDSAKNNRVHVLGKALEVIPDDLDGNWDFRNDKSSKSCSQVVAIQPHILSIFSEALGNSGFRVKAIESQSLALARLLPKTGMFLFVVRDEKLLLGAILDGVVIATHVSSDQDDLSVMSLFISTLKKKYGDQPEIVFVDKDEKLKPKILSDNGLKTEIFELDPLYAMSIKDHLVGEDANVLNIRTQKMASSKEKAEEVAEVVEAVKEEKGKSGMSTREKILGIVFVAVIVVGILLIKLIKK